MIPVLLQNYGFAAKCCLAADASSLSCHIGQERFVITMTDRIAKV
jgi:hypothetical protein